MEGMRKGFDQDSWDGRVSLPRIGPGRWRLTDLGGESDRLGPATEVFNRALREAHAAGGGTVVVPPGVWTTGPIALQSGVALHLEAGAVVRFSRRYEDYPLVRGSYEGEEQIRAEAPLYGENLEDVAITGEGVFDGGGEAWRPVKRMKRTASEWERLLAGGGAVDERKQIWWPTREALEASRRVAEGTAPGPGALEDWVLYRSYLRPPLLSLRRSRRILLEGVTFCNSPAWGLHPWLCEDLTVRRVFVQNPWHAQNGDGLDIDSCRRVRVFGCRFDVGDDAICLKSGRRPGAAAPTREVEIQDCTVFHGHGGVVIGSEMSGGVHDVLVEDCTFLGTDRGLRLKSRPGRGGVVERVTFRRIRMSDIAGEAIVIDCHYEDGTPAAGPTPTFRNLLFEDVVVRGAETAVRAAGLEEAPISDLRLCGVTLDARRGIALAQVARVRIDEARLRVAEGPWLDRRGAEDVEWTAVTDEGPDRKEILG